MNWQICMIYVVLASMNFQSVEPVGPPRNRNNPPYLGQTNSAPIKCSIGIITPSEVDDIVAGKAGKLQFPIPLVVFILSSQKLTNNRIICRMRR
jgi:hypothetical protein